MPAHRAVLPRDMGPFFHPGDGLGKREAILASVGWLHYSLDPSQAVSPGSKQPLMSATVTSDSPMAGGPGSMGIRVLHAPPSSTRGCSPALFQGHSSGITGPLSTRYCLVCACTQCAQYRAGTSRRGALDPQGAQQGGGADSQWAGPEDRQRPGFRPHNCHLPPAATPHAATVSSYGNGGTVCARCC